MSKIGGTGLVILVLCVCVRVRGVFGRLVELSLVSGGICCLWGDRVSEGLKMALVLIVMNMP